MTVKNYSVDRSANLIININVSNTSAATVDLSEYSTNAYYKTHPEASNNVVMTTNGHSNGLLIVSLTGVQTANVTLGRYMYEVYVTHTASNTTHRIQEGLLSFTGGLS